MNKVFYILILILSSLIVQSCGTSKEVVKESPKKEEKKEALTIDSYEVKKNLSLGHGDMKQKNYDKALAYFNKALKMAPSLEDEKPVVLKFKAKCYEGLDSLEQAKTYYLKYIEKNPEDMYSLIKIESFYSKEENAEKVIEFSKKILKNDPTKNNYNRKIGVKYYNKAISAKKEGASNDEVLKYALHSIEYFEKYLENDPNDEVIAGYVNMLSAEYLDQDQLKKRYEDNISENPDDYESILGLAAINYKQGHREEAKKLYEKAFQKDPKNIRVVKSLIALNKTNIEASIKYNKKAFELDNSNENYLMKLAQLYAEKKEYVRARSYCIKAKQVNKNNPGIYKVWGDIYSTCVTNCASSLDYQDKLVLTIAYKLYRKSGNDVKSNTMKQGGHVPTKADYFTNKKIRAPKKACYKWIKKDWPEFLYIEDYLNNM